MNSALPSLGWKKVISGSSFDFLRISLEPSNPSAFHQPASELVMGQAARFDKMFHVKHCFPFPKPQGYGIKNRPVLRADPRISKTSSPIGRDLPRGKPGTAAKAFQGEAYPLWVS